MSPAWVKKLHHHFVAPILKEDPSTEEEGKVKGLFFKAVPEAGDAASADAKARRKSSVFDYGGRIFDPTLVDLVVDDFEEEELAANP